MELNGMVVKQVNGIYYVFNEFGELKADIYLPNDGQLMADFRTMEYITRAIAIRWGIIKPKKK